MHLKNENEMNSIANQTIAKTATTSSTSSNCTSSTDSGVIIIDNETILNNNCNNNNNSNNNSNISNGTEDNSNEKTKKDTNTTTLEETLNNNRKNIINKSDKSNASNTIDIENIINITKKPNNKDVAATRQDIDQQQCWARNLPQSAGSNHCSPTLSIRSTSISIVSIDENAVDSSIIDTDSECEDDAEGVHSKYIVRKLGQQTTYSPDSPDLPTINRGLKVIGQKISPGVGLSPGVGPLAENILNGGLSPSHTQSGAIASQAPQIGSIALTNSTDVTFGDKHFYEGPVTIQQFLIDSRDKWKQQCNEDGQDNPTFDPECDTKDANGATPERNSPSSGLHRFVLNRKSIIITTTIIVLATLIGILIVVTNSFNITPIRTSKQVGDGDDFRKNIPINSTIDEGIVNGTLSIVKRDGWKAKKQKDILTKLNLPVHRVIISHTATDTCSSKAVCSVRALVIQNFHMESYNWDDIGYNFLIGGDGRVYEGRGWDDQGAHTKGYNVDSVGISFIGTFMSIKPAENMLKALQLLLEEGVRLKKLIPDYRLYGHRQFSGTESPGESLYNIIKTWPHWSNV